MIAASIYTNTIHPAPQTESHLQYLLQYHQRTAHNAVYALLRKTEAWKEENEYRKIIVDKLNPFHPDNFVPKDLLVFYPDNVLAEINFGYKCNPEMQDVLIKCIKKHYSGWEKIQMYSVKILETNGSLYREKIENA